MRKLWDVFEVAMNDAALVVAAERIA